MAETVVVQRGHIGTHNMYVHPGDRPTGVWASIEAQNAGIIAGNWQCHLMSSPAHNWWEVQHSSPGWDVEMLNFWRLNWPRLGSYTHLSFWAKNIELVDKYSFVLQIGVQGAGDNWFHAATVNYNFKDDERTKITFQWNMEDSNLNDHLDDDIKMRVLGYRRVEEGQPYGWIIKMNKWCMYTANCPF